MRYMKKQIGILTHPLRDNYGGILQAAALYAHIEHLGHQPVLIRKDVFSPAWKRSLRFALERLPFQDYRNLRSNRANMALHGNFIDEYFPSRTKEVFTKAELECVAKEEQFDSVIVGSDQVWRLEYIDPLYYGNYFLDFLHGLRTKKIAYAASFGVDTWNHPSVTQEISELLADFDAISVRESSGLAICAELGRPDCQHVVDPTLLVDPTFYKGMFGAASSTKPAKLLHYVLDQSHFSEEVLSECLTYRTAGIKVERIYSASTHYQRYTIPEWVKAFHEADFIVTDSFHGTVFSILFNKPFIAISNKARGSSRFDSLLTKLHLRPLLITTSEDIHTALRHSKEIDYDHVNSIIKAWRSSSDTFLNLALQDCDFHI